MTVVHTYFYIVVDTQRGCRTLKFTGRILLHGVIQLVVIMRCWHGRD